MKLIISNILVFSLLFSLVACSTSRATNYAKLSRQLQNQIEKNFDSWNVFFYQVDDNPREFLIWSYSNSTVNWKRFYKGKLESKGSFTSHKNLDKLNINQINQTLEIELNLLEKSPNCKMVLDGENFGYVIEIENRTVIGLNAISSSECFKESKDNFITEDFKTVRDLTYTFN